MPASDALSTSIRRACARSGLPLERLAASLGKGFRPTTLQWYMRGSVIPNKAKTLRIAEYFGLDPEELMAYRKQAVELRENPYTGCTIPSRQSEGRQDMDDPTCWTGTMFCANGCPDAEHLPAGCKATCDPAAHITGHCRLTTICPCGQPPTADREAAFERWLAERQRRTCSAARHDNPVAQRRAAMEAGNGDGDDATERLW